MSSLVSAIQMTSTDDVEANLVQAAKLIVEAAAQGSKLLVLPEMFALITHDAATKLASAEEFGQGKVQDFLSTQARQHNIWIVGGTVAIKSADHHKSYASCLVFDNAGVCVGRYDKMHLFDVEVSPQEIYQESASFLHGENIVVIDTPFGCLGLTICYDLRFPELFRTLFNRGVEIFVVPAAFTVVTGQAHFEILLRSRAIENLCYCIAACQVGQNLPQRATYGHSMIVSPWGEVLAQQAAEPGVVTAAIDLEFLKTVRKKIPVQQHQRSCFKFL